MQQIITPNIKPITDENITFFIPLDINLNSKIHLYSIILRSLNVFTPFLMKISAIESTYKFKIKNKP